MSNQEEEVGSKKPLPLGKILLFTGSVMVIPAQVLCYGSKDASGPGLSQVVNTWLGHWATPAWLVVLALSYFVHRAKRPGPARELSTLRPFVHSDEAVVDNPQWNVDSAVVPVHPSGPAEPSS